MAFFCYLWLPGFPASAAPTAPELEASLPSVEGVPTTTDGVVELSWSDRSPATYQLEQRVNDGAFELRYEGSDQASVRTGLPPGDHVFRVRAVDPDGQPSAWSELNLKVEYMNASRVRLLLITGGIVVFATITAIIHGHINHRREGSS